MNGKFRKIIRINTALFGAVLLVAASISLIFAGCEAAAGGGSLAAAPGAPTNLKAEVESRDSVRLTWTAPTEPGKKGDGLPDTITGYTVYWMQSDTAPDAANVMQNGSPSQEAISSTTYTVSGLTEGQTYHFVVTAKNTTRSGNPSDTVSAIPNVPVNTAPGMPTDIRAASAASQGAVSMSWTAPVNTGFIDGDGTKGIITAYTIYWMQSDATLSAESLKENGDLVLVAGTETSETIEGLTGGKTYYLIVTATNATGESALPSVLTWIPGSGPGAPTGLKVSETSTSIPFTLEWTAPENTGFKNDGSGNPGTISTYTIYWLDSALDPNASVASILAGHSKVLNSGLTATLDSSDIDTGKTYFVIVAATNEIGEGEPSSPIMVSETFDDRPPSAPESLRILQGGRNNITLDWEAPAQPGYIGGNGEEGVITKYTVYYKTSGDVSTSSYDATQAVDKLPTESAAASGATIYGLTEKTAYWFIVTAHNDSGESLATAVLSASTDGVPGAPTGVSSNENTASSITLTWTAPTDTGLINGTGDRGIISGYTVYWSAGIDDGSGGVSEPRPEEVTAAGNMMETTQTSVVIDTIKDAGTSVALTAATEYYFVVTANNATGSSLPVDVFSTSTTSANAAPGAPGSLVESANGLTTFELSWSEPQNTGYTDNNGSKGVITKYTVYWSDTDTDKTDIKTNADAGSTREVMSGTSVRISGLDKDTTYHFIVTAWNGTGEGEPTDPITRTPADRAPGAPTGIGYTSADASGIELEWSGASDTGIINGDGSAGTLTKYTVYWTAAVADGSGGFIVQKADDVKTNGTSQDVTAPNPGESLPETLSLAAASDNSEELVTGTTYYFVVTAWNDSGESNVSGTLVAAASAVQTDRVPGTPLGLTVDSVSQSSISISWTAPDDTGIKDGNKGSITEYTVYSSDTDTDIQTNGSSSTVTGTTATISGLGENKQYYFVVTASNSVGEGPGSAAISAKTEAENEAPGKPIALDIPTVNGTSMTLEWMEPNNKGLINGDGTIGVITQYTVYWIADDPASPTDAASVKANGQSKEVRDAVSTVIDGLTEETKYQFTVSAHNAFGEGEGANPFAATTGSPPGAPTDLTLKTVDKSSISIQWTAPTETGLIGGAGDGTSANISGYTVYWSDSSNVSTGSPTNKAVIGTEATIDGLNAGTRYYIVVTAHNGSGEGAASSIFYKTTTPDDRAPSAPTGLKVSTKSESSISIEWSEPMDPGIINGDGTMASITDYKVYWSSVSGVSRERHLGTQEISASAGRTATISGLRKDSQYYMVVSAVNATGEGIISREIEVMVTQPNSPPGAPTGLGFGASDTSSISLEWTAPTDTGVVGNTGTKGEIQGYTVYWATTNTNIKTTGSNMKVADTSAHITGLTEGTTYYFMVSAHNAAGESSTGATFSGPANYATEIKEIGYSVTAYSASAGSTVELTPTVAPAAAQLSFEISPNTFTADTGLNFDPATGRISGTAGPIGAGGTHVAMSAFKRYVITAIPGTGYAGRTTTALTINVVDQKVITATYAGITAGYGDTITSVTPQLSDNGFTGTYSASLPDGLDIEENTGTISGTVTEIPETSHVYVTLIGSGEWANVNTRAAVPITVARKDLSSLEDTAFAVDFQSSVDASRNLSITLGYPKANLGTVSTTGGLGLRAGTDYTWSIINATTDYLITKDFAINAATGILSVTNFLNADDNEKVFKLRAKGINGYSGYKEIELTVLTAIEISDIQYGISPLTVGTGRETASLLPILTPKIPADKLTGIQYAVSPTTFTFDTGLVFDENTGAISGTAKPVTEAFTKDYAISVVPNSDSGYTGTPLVFLRVDIVLDPVIQASYPDIDAIWNTAIAPVLPELSDTEFEGTFAISPDINSIGLSFDSNSGEISGTPNTLQTTTSYTVTLSGDPNNPDWVDASAAAAFELVVAQLSIENSDLAISYTSPTNVSLDAVGDVTIDPAGPVTNTSNLEAGTDFSLSIVREGTTSAASHISISSDSTALGQIKVATNFDILDAGAYDIIATGSGNYRGSKTVGSIELTVNSLPSAPRSVEIVEVSETQIDLKWMRPYNTGYSQGISGSITGYKVYYQETGQGDIVDTSTVPFMEVTEARASITGLTPGTAYNIAVAAQSSSGEGGLSSQVTENTHIEIGKLPDSEFLVLLDKSSIDVPAEDGLDSAARASTLGSRGLMPGTHFDWQIFEGIGEDVRTTLKASISSAGVISIANSIAAADRGTVFTVRAQGNNRYKGFKDVQFTVNVVERLISITYPDYTSALELKTGSPITSFVPTSRPADAIALYTIEPDSFYQDTGLIFNRATGGISGTAANTSMPEAKTYTISAEGTKDKGYSGSVSAEISIQIVADTVIVVSYPEIEAVYNEELTPVSPRYGGAVLTGAVYALTSVLPQGLQMDASGAISGIPTVVQTIPQEYTVSITADGQTQEVKLSIAVLPQDIAHKAIVFSYTQDSILLEEGVARADVAVPTATELDGLAAGSDYELAIELLQAKVAGISIANSGHISVSEAITSIASGTYAVAAYGRNNYGGRKEVGTVRIKVGTAFPSAPRNVVTENTGAEQITLRWDAPLYSGIVNNQAGSIDHYTVYWSTFPDFDTASTPNSATAASTSLTISDLTSGVIRYFRITAHNQPSGGEGPASSRISATPTAAQTTDISTAQDAEFTVFLSKYTVPIELGAAQANIAAAMSAGTWNLVPGTDFQWSVYGTDNQISQLISINANTGVLALTSAKVADTLAQKVIVRASGIGNYSGYKTVELNLSRMANTLPDAPTAITAAAKAGSDDSISVGWTAPGNTGYFNGARAEIIGYTVYWGLRTGNRPQKKTVFGTSDTPAPTSLDIDGLNPASEYYFAVRTETLVGESGDSGEQSARTSGTALAAKTPGAPRIISVNTGDAMAAVTWEAPEDTGRNASGQTDSISGYTIYYSKTSPLDPEDAATMSNTALADELAKDITGLDNGETYYFVIKAENNQGLGDASAEKSITPSAAPARDIANLPTDEFNISLSSSTITVISGKTNTAAAKLSSTGSLGLTNGIDYTMSLYMADGVTPSERITLNEDGSIEVSALVRTTDTERTIKIFGIGNYRGERIITLKINVLSSSLSTPPWNINAAAGENRISVSWNRPTDTGYINGAKAELLKYTVYWGYSSGFARNAENSRSIANTITDTEFTDISAGKRVYYRVTATTLVGESLTFRESSAVPTGVSYNDAVPDAPAWRSLTPGNGQVTVEWTAPENTGYYNDRPAAITGYKVFYIQGGMYIRGTSVFINEDDMKSHLIEGAVSTSLQIRNLTNDEPWSFVIKAINAVGESALSEEIIVTPTDTTVQNTVPGPVANVAGTAQDAAVELTWDEPDNKGKVGGNQAAISAWTIRYYSETNPYVPQEVKLTNAATRSTRIEGLINGVSYYFLVYAENANGLSITPSNTFAIKPVADLPNKGLLQDTGFSFTADATYQLVSGQSHTIDLTITNDTGLSAGTDYEFSIEGPVDAAYSIDNNGQVTIDLSTRNAAGEFDEIGTYTVKAEGRGGYTGNIAWSFEVSTYDPVFVISGTDVKVNSGIPNLKMLTKNPAFYFDSDTKETSEFNLKSTYYTNNEPYKHPTEEQFSTKQGSGHYDYIDNNQDTLLLEFTFVNPVTIIGFDIVGRNRFQGRMEGLQYQYFNGTDWAELDVRADGTEYGGKQMLNTPAEDISKVKLVYGKGQTLTIRQFNYMNIFLEATGITARNTVYSLEDPGVKSSTISTDEGTAAVQQLQFNPIGLVGGQDYSLAIVAGPNTSGVVSITDEGEIIVNDRVQYTDAGDYTIRLQTKGIIADASAEATFKLDIPISTPDSTVSADPDPNAKTPVVHIEAGTIASDAAFQQYLAAKGLTGTLDLAIQPYDADPTKQVIHFPNASSSHGYSAISIPRTKNALVAIVYKLDNLEERTNYLFSDTSQTPFLPSTDPTYFFSDSGNNRLKSGIVYNGQEFDSIREIYKNSSWNILVARVYDNNHIVRIGGDSSRGWGLQAQVAEVYVWDEIAAPNIDMMQVYNDLAAKWKITTDPKAKSYDVNTGDNLIDDIDGFSFSANRFVVLKGQKTRGRLVNVTGLNEEDYELTITGPNPDIITMDWHKISSSPVKRVGYAIVDESFTALDAGEYLLTLTAKNGYAGSKTVKTDIELVQPLFTIDEENKKLKTNADIPNLFVTWSSETDDVQTENDISYESLNLVAGWTPDHYLNFEQALEHPAVNQMSITTPINHYDKKISNREAELLDFSFNKPVTLHTLTLVPRVVTGGSPNEFFSDRPKGLQFQYYDTDDNLLGKVDYVDQDGLYSHTLDTPQTGVARLKVVLDANATLVTNNDGEVIMQFNYVNAGISVSSEETPTTDIARLGLDFSKETEAILGKMVVAEPINFQFNMGGLHYGRDYTLQVSGPGSSKINMDDETGTLSIADDATPTEMDGTYTLTASGIGQYTGSIAGNFDLKLYYTLYKLVDAETGAMAINDSVPGITITPTPFPGFVGNEVSAWRVKNTGTLGNPYLEQASRKYADQTWRTTDREKGGTLLEYTLDKPVTVSEFIINENKNNQTGLDTGGMSHYMAIQLYDVDGNMLFQVNSRDPDANGSGNDRSDAFLYLQDGEWRTKLKNHIENVSIIKYAIYAESYSRRFNYINVYFLPQNE